MATKKFHVQAVSRPGFDGSYRAGRKWPSGTPTEIEVLEQPHDPPHDPKLGVRVGAETFKALKADKNLIVRTPGDPMEHAQTVESLQAEVASLKARLAKYEKGEKGETGKTETATKVETAKAEAGEATQPGVSTEGVMTEGEAKTKRR